MNQTRAAQIVADALAEDIGDGDITTEAVVPAGASASAEIISHQSGLLAGLPVAEIVFKQLNSSLDFLPLLHDGDCIQPGSIVARVEGDAGSILTGERAALNFLQRLSGIASMTSRFVQACAGTSSRIVDSRKTAPGLRTLDKYAVRVGGARNHRFGLYDGVLIKDNHIRAGGGITRAVASARARAPHTVRVEVECETLAQVDEAILAGADIVLLDNMSTAEMSVAVKTIAGKALVEASGNMTLQRIPEVAAVGVDIISVGALTHSVTALDLSLEIVAWRLPGEFEA